MINCLAKFIHCVRFFFTLVYFIIDHYTPLKVKFPSILSILNIIILSVSYVKSLISCSESLKNCKNSVTFNIHISSKCVGNCQQNDSRFFNWTLIVAFVCSTCIAQITNLWHKLYFLWLIEQYYLCYIKYNILNLTKYKLLQSNTKISFVYI